MLVVLVVVFGVTACTRPGDQQSETQQAETQQGPDYNQQAVGAGSLLCFSFSSAELAERFDVRPGDGFARRLGEKIYTGSHGGIQQVQASFARGCVDGQHKREDVIHKGGNEP